MAFDMERVPEDSPDRCQGIRGNRQCSCKKVPGSNYCKMCGGMSVEKNNFYNFKSTMFKARLQRLSNPEELKTLVNEIGILRLLIEERINSCQDPSDLLMNSSAISELVMKLEKLVTSWTKIERYLKLSISREELMEWLTNIHQILSEECTDEQLIRIGERLSALPTPGSDGSLTSDDTA